MTRDYSNRYTVEIRDINMKEYYELSLKIITHFNLESKGDKVIGYDEEFQDYTLDEYVISLEYDIWIGLTIVAKNDFSITLLNNIYLWLIEKNKFKGTDLR